MNTNLFEELLEPKELNDWIMAIQHLRDAEAEMSKDIPSLGRIYRLLLDSELCLAWARREGLVPSEGDLHDVLLQHGNLYSRLISLRKAVKAAVAE